MLSGAIYLCVTLKCVTDHLGIGGILKYIGIVHQFSDSLSALLNGVLDLRFKTGFLENYLNFADQFTKEMEKLPKALFNAKEAFDPLAGDYASRYGMEPLTYVLGAGNLWDYAYCYAMCVMEECQWIRTKSVNAGEFFHGTLELMEKGVNVLVLQGEDSSRPLTERAVRFLKRVTDKLTVIDTKDYCPEIVNPKFRGLLSPMIMYQLCERISKHLEKERKHPLEMRRYYRRLSY